MCFHRRDFLATFGASAMLLAGCRSAPFTGRKQLVFLPQQQEIAMAQEAFAQVLATEKPTSNVRIQGIVQRVGARIAAVSERPDFQWDFRVFDSPSQNAFALPGGKVGVYEGIIPVCQSEAGLAVVMSHEIGHTIARHGAERISQEAAASGAKSILGYAMSGSSETGRTLVLNAYGAATQYGLLLPYSRKHELEADLIGLHLMAKAGYDPAEAPRFWERFSAASTGPQPPTWASTHPSDAQRAQQLAFAVPQANQLYQAAPIRVGLGEMI